MLGLILSILIGGFVVGGLARLAIPGPDPMPWWLTIALGWAGALIGGLVARVLLGTSGGIVFAILGAMLLVVLYRRFAQGRGITGPDARRHPGRRH